LVGKNSLTTSSFRQRVKLVILTILSPDETKRMVGVKTVSAFGVKDGITKGEWALIILASFIFGLAHYISGAGWGPGKISTAFISGFVFALVYLIYGAYAPILLHWFFNYYLEVYFIAVDVYPVITFFYSLVLLVTLTLGAVGWMTVAILGIRRLFGSS